MMKLTITNESGETLTYDGKTLTVPLADLEDFQNHIYEVINRITQLERLQLEAAKTGQVLPTQFTYRSEFASAD